MSPLETAQATATEPTAPAAEPASVQTSDTNGTAETTQPESTADDTPAGNGNTPDDELLTPEEEGAIREQFKDKPEELLRALRRAYSEKTTKLKAARTEAAQALQFVQWFRKDPRAAILAMAQRDPALKITVDGASPAGRTEEQSAQAADAIVKKLGDALGEDVAGSVRDLVKQALAEGLRPVQEFHQQQAQQTAIERAEATLEQMTARHPDWKKYDKRMTELSREMPASKGVSDLVYMERLYRLAKSEEAPARAAAADQKRTEASIAASTSPVKGVADKNVSKAGGKMSMRESYQAAQRQLGRS